MRWASVNWLWKKNAETFHEAQQHRATATFEYSKHCTLRFEYNAKRSTTVRPIEKWASFGLSRDYRSLWTSLCCMPVYPADMLCLRNDDRRYEATSDVGKLYEKRKLYSISILQNGMSCVCKYCIRSEIVKSGTIFIENCVMRYLVKMAQPYARCCSVSEHAYILGGPKTKTKPTSWALA